MDTTKVVEILKLVWPLIVVQVIIQVYALFDLYKRKKTKNLSPIIWVLIIVLGEIIGAAAYFIVGRSEE